ncbi:MAG TPA: TolC family protein [Pyrinomonadaceae bacterium]
MSVNKGIRIWLLIFLCVWWTASLKAQQSTKPIPAASPQATPFEIPKTPETVTKPESQPTPPTIVSPSLSTTQGPTTLTLDDALRLANAQASGFQQATLQEKIAEEDLRQAKSALLPSISAPLSYIYTSPAHGLQPGEPRVPSFIAADAISAYQAYLQVSGDFDLSGKLRATLAKNRALLAAAHAGTEVARRALAQAVIEAYYGLSLAVAQRQAAEGNLAAAEDFERITSLLLNAGEVASVDLTRAELQTIARRDELEKARAAELVAGGSLRVFVGYDFTAPIGTSELSLSGPVEADFLSPNVADVTRRPEFLQFDSQLRAAQQDIKIARADRLPSLTYELFGGFDTDSLRGPALKEHSGVSAAISLNIPIFDWGVRKSKETQARLNLQAAENERTIALRGFTQQFYAAKAEAASAAARIRLTRDGITKAESNLNASIARYRAGEAQIVEVTDAQTTLVAQRSAYYQALFDYQTALGRLRQATGK